MNDAAIIKTLQRENKPHELTMAETLKLTKAGVSSSVIDAIGDPKSASASAGAPAPEPPKVAPAVLTPRGAPAVVSVAAPSG